MKTVTDFNVLMKLAGALGQAEKRGDPAAIAAAKAEHDAYKALCLSADAMTLRVPYSDLL